MSILAPSSGGISQRNSPLFRDPNQIMNKERHRDCKKTWFQHLRDVSDYELRKNTNLSSTKRAANVCLYNWMFCIELENDPGAIMQLVTFLELPNTQKLAKSKSGKRTEKLQKTSAISATVLHYWNPSNFLIIDMNSSHHEMEESISLKTPTLSENEAAAPFPSEDFLHIRSKFVLFHLSQPVKLQREMMYSLLLPLPRLSQNGLTNHLTNSKRIRSDPDLISGSTMCRCSLAGCPEELTKEAGFPLGLTRCYFNSCLPSETQIEISFWNCRINLQGQIEIGCDMIASVSLGFTQRNVSCKLNTQIVHRNITAFLTDAVAPTLDIGIPYHEGTDVLPIIVVTLQSLCCLKEREVKGGGERKREEEGRREGREEEEGKRRKEIVKAKLEICREWREGEGERGEGRREGRREKYRGEVKVGKRKERDGKRWIVDNTMELSRKPTQRKPRSSPFEFYGEKRHLPMARSSTIFDPQGLFSPYSRQNPSFVAAHLAIQFPYGTANKSQEENELHSTLESQLPSLKLYFRLHVEKNDKNELAQKAATQFKVNQPDCQSLDSCSDEKVDARNNMLLKAQNNVQKCFLAQFYTHNDTEGQEDNRKNAKERCSEKREIRYCQMFASILSEHWPCWLKL
ncbi:Neurofilament medium polypeptide, partial [Ophiophagus hannah]